MLYKYKLQGPSDHDTYSPISWRHPAKELKYDLKRSWWDHPDKVWKDERWEKDV